MIRKSLLSNKYNGFIKQNRSFLLALVKIVDVFIIVYLYFEFLEQDAYFLDKKRTVILIVAALSFEFFATINNLYGIPRGARFSYIIKNTITAWLATVFLVVTFVAFSRDVGNDERTQMLYWVVLTPIVMLAWHLSLRLFLVFLRKVGKNNRVVAIAGATALGMDLEDIINRQPWMGLSLVGYFDDRADYRIKRTADVNLLGNYKDMIEKAKRGELDVIFITLPMCSQNRIKAILDALSDTSVVVYFIPDFFVFDLLGARVESFNGLPTICVFDTPHGGLDGFSKRIFDIVVSVIILTIICIPMLIISVGVKLSSPGPVLFCQRRYGFRGEEILVWKFRTMRVCEDGDVVKQATQGDPRITKFGQFLRRTSLDEFPQFINTLQGRMSIVGPRPHAVAHNEFYRGQIKGYMLRHNVKPGITGLAQIRGFRGETDTLDKMEGRVHSDLEYIHNWSIWLDLEILFLTVFKGFLNKNAY